MSSDPGEVAASGDVIELAQDAAGKVGSGTATNGLRPDASPSVELRGTAPSAKVELSTLPGVGGSDEIMQLPPDGAARPNGDVTAVLGNVSVELSAVGSAGNKLDVALANPFTGHAVMLPAAIPPAGAPRLSRMVPNANPDALVVGLVTPAGLDSAVAADAELPGIGAGCEAVCATLVPHPSKSMNAAVDSKRRGRLH